MANLPETPTYDAGVYQLEVTDPVVGGASGVSNTPLKNLANRTAYLKGEVDGMSGSLTTHLNASDPHQVVNVAAPPGAVLTFAMGSAPVGWLKANGAAVSRSTYAALFAAIGVTYGVGNGSTTFNLPDLRGEFIRCWDDGRGVDTGRVLGSSQKGTLVPLDDPGTNATVDTFRNYPSDIGGDTASGGDYPSVVLSFSADVLTVAGGAGSAVTRPRNIALLACIKY